MYFCASSDGLVCNTETFTLFSVILFCSHLGSSPSSGGYLGRHLITSLFKDLRNPHRSRSLSICGQLQNQGLREQIKDLIEQDVLPSTSFIQHCIHFNKLIILKPHTFVALRVEENNEEIVFVVLHTILFIIVLIY